VARIPFTTWYGHLLKVSTPCNMPLQPRGLVLHISDGVLSKNKVKQVPDLVGLASTFNSTNFPAHFGISPQGQIAQYIDTSKQDRATERGGDWFSVECCVFRGDALTDSQVTAAGFLFALLREWYKTFPLEVANSVTDSGLAYHSLFLTDVEKMDPKKHANCPGPLVIAQRATIIERAKTIFGP
jgi:hypothetical protein